MPPFTAVLFTAMVSLFFSVGTGLPPHTTLTVTERPAVIQVKCTKQHNNDETYRCDFVQVKIDRPDLAALPAKAAQWVAEAKKLTQGDAGKQQLIQFWCGAHFQESIARAMNYPDLPPSMSAVLSEVNKACQAQDVEALIEINKRMALLEGQACRLRIDSWSSTFKRGAPGTWVAQETVDPCNATRTQRLTKHPNSIALWDYHRVTTYPTARPGPHCPAEIVGKKTETLHASWRNKHLRDLNCPYWQF